MVFQGKQRHMTEKVAEITGIYKGYTRSFGFVVTPDGEDDVYVAEENRHTAMSNDKVIVKITSSVGKRKEGTIATILERANETLVGTYDRQAHFGFVTPDDPRLHEDVYIPLDKALNARTGESSRKDYGMASGISEGGRRNYGSSRLYGR